MKISSLLENITPASAPNQEGSQAPQFGRDPNVLENDDKKIDETTTSGSVASVAQPMGKVQKRGKGSIFQGVKTSKKFPNSAPVTESSQDVSEARRNRADWEMDAELWFKEIDGKMWQISIFPNQRAQARAEGWAPSKQEARDMAYIRGLAPKDKGVAEGSLEEISQDTARSYVQKARASQKDLINQTYRKGADTDKLNKKIQNRQQGLNRAHTDKRYYKDELGVAEGLDAEAYKEKLLATLPDMMRFYEKNVKGWKPSEEQMLAAVETGYTVMKHTGDVKQAGRAVMDELNTLHRMSQGQQGVTEGSVDHRKLGKHHEEMTDQELRKVGSKLPDSWDGARFRRKLASHPKYAQALKHYDKSEYHFGKAAKQGVAEGAHWSDEWEPVKDIKTKTGQVVGMVMRHSSGTYAYYDNRKHNIESGFSSAEQARQAFVELHNARVRSNNPGVAEGFVWSSKDQKMKHHSEFPHTHTAKTDIKSSMTGEVMLPKGSRLSELGNDNYLNLDTGSQPYKIESSHLLAAVEPGVAEGNNPVDHEWYRKQQERKAKAAKRQDRQQTQSKVAEGLANANETLRSQIIRLYKKGLEDYDIAYDLDIDEKTVADIIDDYDKKQQQRQSKVAEGTGQPLSVQQLATISDAALDQAYGYGRSTPGNSFGWQANLMSAAYAKKLIDAGVTDIEKISDAIHKGWNVTAQKFVQNPEQFDDTEKLRQAGKLDAKLQQRAKLMKINYAQLDNEEQEKDRVVARALLQAITGQQGVAEAWLPTYNRKTRRRGGERLTPMSQEEQDLDRAVRDAMAAKDLTKARQLAYSAKRPVVQQHLHDLIFHLQMPPDFYSPTPRPPSGVAEGFGDIFKKRKNPADGIRVSNGIAYTGDKVNVEGYPKIEGVVSFTHHHNGKIAVMLYPKGHRPMALAVEPSRVSIKQGVAEGFFDRFKKKSSNPTPADPGKYPQRDNVDQWMIDTVEYYKATSPNSVWKLFCPSWADYLPTRVRVGTSSEVMRKHMDTYLKLRAANPEAAQVARQNFDPDHVYPSGPADDYRRVEETVGESKDDQEYTVTVNGITVKDEKTKEAKLFTKDEAEKEASKIKADRIKQDLPATSVEVKSKNAVTEDAIREEQLLAKDLKKRLELFKKGKDKELGDKPKDKELGNKPKDTEFSEKEEIDENLRKWFKEKWVRFGPDGKIRGACARGDDSEGKPKCLPQAKAHALGKKGRKYAANKKRREDPNPERKGKAINVATKKKSNESVEEQKCPECGGPMFTDLMLAEKKDACYNKVRSRYKVWPSAYASGALVQCRKKGAANWGNSKSK